MNPERVDPSKGAVPFVGGSADGRAQRLSCLLDGELDEQECRALVEALRGDEEAGRKWALFNCVGDAMRSAEAASWHSDSFVARVSAALEQEPTVLAPAALAPRSAARRWLLPGAGAVAAAALLLAVGLPSRQAVSPETMAVGAPAAPTAAVIAVQGPVQIDRSPQLERYLAAHRELAEPTLMPNSTPYVRTSGAMPLQEGR
jgi:sigma-E factor negative regulatory protein RseA